MAWPVNWMWQNGTGGKDVLTAAAMDVNGSSVHAGYTSGNWSATVSTDDDSMNYLAALKLDADGTLLWKYQNGTSGHDRFFAVAVGEDGSSVLAGETNFDFAVVKLDADGNTLWEFQDGTDGEDVASGVAISPEDGSVIVVGTADGDWQGTSSGREDFAAFKLDSNGTLVWKWQDGTESSDSLSAVAMVDDGFVVSGHTGGSYGAPSTGDFDFVAIKLDDDAGGAEVWRWQAGSGVDDRATAIAAVGSEDIVVAGVTNGYFSGDNAGDAVLYFTPVDFVAVKLNGTDGKEVWRWQDGTELYDVVAGVAVQADGTIVLGGTTFEQWGSLPSARAGTRVNNYTAVYLTHDGQELMSFQSGADDDGGNGWINGVTTSPDGTVVLAGCVDGWYLPEGGTKYDARFFIDFFVTSLETSIVTEIASEEYSSAEALRATPIVAWVASATVAVSAFVTL